MRHDTHNTGTHTIVNWINDDGHNFDVVANVAATTTIVAAAAAANDDDDDDHSYNPYACSSCRRVHTQ